MSNYDQVVVQAITNRYQNVDKTKRDATNTLKHYRGLAPKLEKFVFNDGTEKQLLNLDGTIPVRYKGNTYNIPICVWLLDNHPNSSPMVYVKPTSDMLIKASRHVDQNGKVYLPYLHEWNPNQSDLLGLIQIMIMTFSEMPPVYSKPKNSQQATPASYPSYAGQSSYMPVPSSGSTGSTTGPGALPYPAGPPAGSTGYPPYPTPSGYPHAPTGYSVFPPSTTAAYPMPAGPPPPYPMGSAAPYPPYPPVSSVFTTSQTAETSNVTPSGLPDSIITSTSTGTITEEHIRASLISAVTDKVRMRLRDSYGGAQAEISVLRQQQTDLNQGKIKLENLVKKLDQEQAELEKNIRVLQEKETEMKTVLDRLSSTTEPVDVDEAVTTTAPLYKQLLNAYAEDQATQDAIYYLGEALRRDVIDLDTFLKHVRALSRKQFQLRAVMNKCRAKANLAG